ncbi:LytR C-terminal domain-containing protein [Streptomyces naganishii]|uniref:LytR C-terminal domain-containing protein n=1 Tax=Streptomyces naganishii TaxID=285447 RepID=UPI00367E3F43
MAHFSGRRVRMALAVGICLLAVAAGWAYLRPLVAGSSGTPAGGHAVLGGPDAGRTGPRPGTRCRAGGRPPGRAGDRRAAVAGDGVRVAVYDGTTVGGLAARAAAALAAHGFTVTTTAAARTRDHTATLVEYGPGLHARARTVAAALDGAELRPVPAAGIAVVIGRSYAGAPPGATASPGPAQVPARAAADARPADGGACWN